MNRISGLLPRLIAPRIASALRHFPVVVLTGARQTGKSTLVSSPPLGNRRSYRSLDDFDVLERAQNRPDLLIQEARRMTLDEVQRAPSLLVAIKRSVDRDRKAGRFLLTGSQNLLMMRRISETLAGRAVYLTLWPMAESEKSGNPSPGPWERLLKARNATAAEKILASPVVSHPWEERALAGGYPVPSLQLKASRRSQWFEGYVRTYLERDLQEVASVSALADFRRLMRIAALRIGQMLNQTDLARDAGLSQPTAHRYLNVLETSYQLLRIPAFAVSRTKRLVKSPKLFWTDTGLAAHLAGYGSRRELSPDMFGGALLENLVLTQLLAWKETVSPRPEIYYWRTHTQQEVDFVLEWNRKLLPLEIKRGQCVRLAEIKSLELFLQEYPRLARVGIVFYGGTEVLRLSDRIVAAPIGHALGGNR
jgi:predicted AAA+ superfamily ATPase